MEATVNKTATSAMSSANRELFGYEENKMGSSEAPLFQLPTGGDDLTDYSDWTAAWEEVAAA
jgi:hypothetical protein